MSQRKKGKKTSSSRTAGKAKKTSTRAAKKTSTRAAKKTSAHAGSRTQCPRKPAPAAPPPRPLKGLLTRKIREAQAHKVLLLLSTGNTCRSPMATFYLRKLLEERKIKNIEIRSAGVMTIAGLLATGESKLMLDPYGISLTRHRSQPLTEDMIRRADLVLGMTPFHVQMALRLSSDARGKTLLLKEYSRVEGKERNRPIPDPMGCTLEVYKRCFRQIKQACDRLVELEFITGRPVKAPRAAAPSSKRADAELSKSPLRNKLRPGAGATVSGGSRSRPSRPSKTTFKPASKSKSSKSAAKSGRSRSKK